MSDVEKRVKSLEIAVKGLDARITRIVGDLNRVNKDAYDAVTALEKQVYKTMDKIGDNVAAQNKVNQTAYNHITALEKRFSAMESHSDKVAKMADPKVAERNLMKFIDSALKAYDKSKKR